VTPASVEPRYETLPPMLLAGDRRHHKFADFLKTVDEQWREFRHGGPIPERCSDVFYGAMCQTYQEGFEYMCAVEVSSFEGLAADIGRMRVPEQEYAVFTHRGKASDLPTTWAAIWGDWLPGSGRTPANTPDFEKYGEEFDAETGTGLIEIWFPVEPI
jgi:AraC family transcriptional regulator